MPQATIQVQYVNQPQGNRKTGSIKTADGDYYDVWPDKLPQFQTNGTYTVEFITREWQGKTYKTVKEIVGNGAAQAAPPPQPNGNGQAVYQRGPAQIAPPAAKYGATDDKTAERIFVCGALNAAIGAGIIDMQTPQSLTNAVNVLRLTWGATFGSNTAPRVQDRISSGPIPPDGDSIPF